MPASSDQEGRRPMYNNFSIVVRTSACVNATTRAWVFVQLIDSEGNMTDRVKLKCSHTHRKKFQRGHSDLFLLIDQVNLSDIKKINIDHVKKSDAPPEEQSWHLHSVMVLEHNAHKLYRFPYGKWLGTSDNPAESGEARITLDAEGEPYNVFTDNDMNFFE